jgi:hypothetical protein
MCMSMRNARVTVFRGFKLTVYKYMTHRGVFDSNVRHFYVSHKETYAGRFQIYFKIIMLIKSHSAVHRVGAGPTLWNSTPYLVPYTLPATEKMTSSSRTEEHSRR